MENYNLIPPEELGKDTKIKWCVCEHEVDMYWKVAIEVLEVIKRTTPPASLRL